MAHTSTIERLAALSLLAVLATGCGQSPDTAPEAPERPLRDAADSLAARLAQASGGAAALDALPALRWDFAVVRDSVEASRTHHLWDRVARRHRIEWTNGDSLLVAVFSTEQVVDGLPAQGAVYLDGVPVDTARAPALLEQAYTRFINDMYWLLAPLKVFDPGVHRSVAADSADAESEVLALWFEHVGLTPGDRYWIRVDRDAGRMLGWSFQLQSGRQGTYRWTDWRTIETAAGPIALPTRKVAIGQSTVILTPFTEAEVDASFADPRPVLEPLP